MSDTMWVAVGFIIFLGIAWKFGAFSAVLKGIDSRGEKISADLMEAKRLRTEAEALLASFEKKRHEAEKEAESLIAAAKVEADRLKAEAEQRLNDFVQRRTKQAEVKIAQAELQATADVRAAAAELAVQAAGKVMAKQGTSESAFKAALGEIKAKLN